MTSPVDHVVHAVRHPLSTASYAFGIARGAVLAVAGTVGVGPGADLHDQPENGQPENDQQEIRRPVVPPQPTGPERVFPTDHVPAAPQRAPGEVGEAFTTEASAVNRASAHGGPGADETIDDWYADAEGADDEPFGVVEILEQNDPPGDKVDESAIKAVLTESEKLRRANGSD